MRGAITSKALATKMYYEYREKASVTRPLIYLLLFLYLIVFCARGPKSILMLFGEVGNQPETYVNWLIDID